MSVGEHGVRADLHALHCKACRARELAAEIAKADSGEDLNFDLEEEDAEVAGTLTAVYAHSFTAAGMAEKLTDQPLTPGQLQEAAGRVAFQREQGMAKLSAGAREALGPVMDTAERALRGMVEGRVNPLQAAQEMQRMLALAEQQPGFDPNLYQPYQWARLARTEAAFADTAAREAAYREEYDPDYSAIEAAGARVPAHPNCLCLESVVEIDGKWFAYLDPAPSACELCQDLADEVLAAIGA